MKQKIVFALAVSPVEKCAYVFIVITVIFIIYIFQGRVATQLRYHYTTNFSQNVPVKKFENRSIFGEDMDKFVADFWGHLYNYLL